MTEEGSRSPSRFDIGPAAKELAPSLQESKDKERFSGQSIYHTSKEGAVGQLASLHLAV